MSSHIGVPLIEHPSHPSLYRSRSHSSPSQNVPNAAQSAIERPTRPTHGRSQSYLSPNNPKSQNANTIPTHASTLEKASSKLHLPGKHHLHHEGRKHRYTQSESEQHHRLRKQADTDSLPNLVAGIAAERHRRAAAQDSSGTGSNEVLSAVPGGLTRMMSTRSYRAETAADSRGGGGGRYDLRRRATSDPKAPPRPPTQRVKSPIELDLERAERMRRQRRFTLTTADVARKDKEIEEAEDEMREKIAHVNRAGVEITRRLDYGYYNLLEKVGNLVSTIQSFQSLAQQSRQLVVNFEHETGRLDKDIRRRVDGFKTGFDEKEDRVGRLEVRGREVSKKAEDLGRRLENARIIVENWEKREDRARQVWGRFWGGIWWSVISVLVLILAIVMYKEWWFRGDPVKAGLNLPSGGHWNGSLCLGDGGKGDDILSQANLPLEVRAVLEGIKDRNQRGKNFTTPVSSAENSVIHGDEGDAELKILDNL